MLYIDATAEDKCNNVYHIQFYVPRADFSGTFDLTLGDAQTVHSFEAQSLPSLCSATSNYWTYTIFGSAVADA
jgi:hypothetical protein